MWVHRSWRQRCRRPWSFTCRPWLGPQDLHVTVHSIMDGEKVGEGIAKAKRSSDGRAFHAVAAHGGAF